jgi:hypothetical protein
MSRELCIANDEGVLEDGFYSVETAKARLIQLFEQGEDYAEILYRDLFDEDGVWIEEPDGDEDEE